LDSIVILYYLCFRFKIKKMSKIKTDLFLRTPKIGDIIVFNQPYLKGVLIHGACVGFTSAGCPKINDIDMSNFGVGNKEHYAEKGFYSVKNQFLIK
jgi:hypothetical protein